MDQLSSRYQLTLTPLQVECLRVIESIVNLGQFLSLDISLSCNVPGLLATAGADDTVKFWDIQVMHRY